MALLLPVGLAALWGLWEGYRWLGIRGSWTWPFRVNDTNMPHVSTIWHALRTAAAARRASVAALPLALSLFTGKEALAGFALGALIGFLLARRAGALDAVSSGLLPYIVVSQTVPILAIAPMVVLGLGRRACEPGSQVAVIAAYITFFPVAINTLRGLHSPDPRALELMRSYAAGRWKILWRCACPPRCPTSSRRLKISATASVIGAIIGETPASLQAGLGYAIVNFNQSARPSPQNLWATIIACACSEWRSSSPSSSLERLILEASTGAHRQEPAVSLKGVPKRFQREE